VLAIGWVTPSGGPTEALAGSGKKPRFRVDPRRTVTRVVEFPGGTFEELSAWLYAGERKQARGLRRLNPKLTEPIAARPNLTYSLPKVKVEEGQSLQKLGGTWVDGSARSYVKLLPLNRKLRRNPDHIEPGRWIYLPRVPTQKERQANEALYRQQNGSPAPATATATETAPRAGPATPPAPLTALSAPASGPRIASSLPPRVAPPSAFAPVTSHEKLALLEFYLERLDIQVNRARVEKMVSELVTGPPSGWKAQYLAGQFFLQTDRAPAAREFFRKGLEDGEAPIQVALFYFRASDKAARPVPEDERGRIFERFPALQAVLEADGAEPEAK